MDVNAEAAESHYIMHFFNSSTAKKIVESLCFGVTRLRIDLSMFKTFPIPLPPRREQAEIVSRVSSLFSYADRIETRLRAARTATERLTPALLAKAFRGELVPQDPSDEPACELLRRLQADAPSNSPRQRRKNSA
jgi:type I restriction enzyme, S subunit